MDDEFEDKVFYQTYLSQMKILSKFAVGLSSINSPVIYIWKIFRYYLLRPEILFCGIIIFIFLLYLQTVDVWSRNLLGKLQTSFSNSQAKHNKTKIYDDYARDHQSWDTKFNSSAVFAVLGRRPRMEDRFVLEENINNNTGISFFAIFDGHGGEFAADYAKDILVKNLYIKIIETVDLLKGKQTNSENEGEHNLKQTEYISKLNSIINENKDSDIVLNQRKKGSVKKSMSTTDDCTTPKNIVKETDIYTAKINSLIRPAAKDILLNIGDKNNNGKINSSPPQTYHAKCYIENGKINFGKLISDEILAADYKLVEIAKKTTNVAGTTALIAIIQDTKLIVANVGDSRGVMCDSKGNAIPLSFDHKPQQVRERKRIHDAGGFIAFKGVWRVAGILATSRALGDYPLKDNKLVIPDPDILTFDLNDHKPNFLILASDGLWDTFSNEEAVTFIKEHLNESHFGAKSLALESYHRGSVDNITVLVIVFKNGIYKIGSSNANR